MKVYIVTSNDYSGECHKIEAVFSSYEKAMEYCTYHSNCDIEEFEVDEDYERKETIWKVTFHYESGDIQTADNDYSYTKELNTIHFMACLDYCCGAIPEYAPCLAIYVLADTEGHAKEKARDVYKELVEFTVRGNRTDLVPMMRRCYNERKYPIYDYNTWTCKGWYEQY